MTDQDIAGLETVSVFRGYRYRLHPSPAQAAMLEQWIGVCRLIYNTALQQREDCWRRYLENTGHHITFASQGRELTQARAEFPWIAAGDRNAQEQALRDLDDAFGRFFAGTSAYPRPRRKGQDDSIRFRGRSIVPRKLNAKWSTVSISKLGWIKYRDTRPMRGTIRSATVSCKAGRWFISILTRAGEVAPGPSALPAVGIDRGIANTISLSTGEHISLPATLSMIDRRLRSAHRALARKRRGSARYEKQRRRAASLYARCARIRGHWQHTTTLDLVSRFGTVVLEDLNIAGMTAAGRGKRGLNRSILNQSWGSFATILGYKLEARGGTLIQVPAAYTSQTCSSCGAVDRESRESQASFVCRHCGFALHADHNAALNILRRGSAPSLRMEDGEGPAGEVRTRDGSAVENHVLTGMGPLILLDTLEAPAIRSRTSPKETDNG